jgi:hypothetical protein
MNPDTPTGAPPRYCNLCGDRYWSWGAHAERCTGRVRTRLWERCTGRVPESLPCDCNPGWHEPDCVHVTGYPTPEEPE